MVMIGMAMIGMAMAMVKNDDWHGDDWHGLDQGQTQMGASYTTGHPLARPAVPDGHRRGLTVAQADVALFMRLSAIIDQVRLARQALSGSQIEDALQQINEIENELHHLIEDADYVRITFPENPASEDCSSSSAATLPLAPADGAAA